MQADDEDYDEGNGALRGWTPSAWYEVMRYCLCGRWLLPKGLLLHLAASRCPLSRASLVSVHDSVGRCLAVRRVAADGTFRHRGVRYCWNGATFREERGLDDGQLTCGELVASPGIRSERRRALLRRHGLNEYRIGQRRSHVPGTRWVVIGALLWLLRSYYLSASAAASVVVAIWLAQYCEAFCSRLRSGCRTCKSISTLALPALEEIDSRSLVPGDVLALEPGEEAPCDLVLLSGQCVVDQEEVVLPRMAAKWPLREAESDLFCAHKHRASVILHPSRIVCSRAGPLLAVALRTGAATETAVVRSRPEVQYIQEEEGLGPVQWAVAAVAFLLSLLFWLGRDRFTWDEVLLRALSVHLLLFPPRALLCNWLLEKIAASAMVSAGANSSGGALASAARWARTTSVAIDCLGGLCESEEKLTGVLPSGCQGFAPVIVRGLAEIPRGHPLRWAAAAIGAALWKDGGYALGHPHDVAAFDAAGSGYGGEDDGDFALDTPPEPAGPPLRLNPFVNPFWSTKRLDEDLRATKDPQDLIAVCAVKESITFEPPWITEDDDRCRGDYEHCMTIGSCSSCSSQCMDERPPSTEVPQVVVQEPASHFSPRAALLVGLEAFWRLSGRVTNNCPMCPKKQPPPSLPSIKASIIKNGRRRLLERIATPEAVLRERSDCRRLRVIECRPRSAGCDRTTILYRTRRQHEVVCVGKLADVLPLCSGAHSASSNVEAVAASFYERGFGVAAVAFQCCPEELDGRGLVFEDHLSFNGLFLFEPVVNPQAASAMEEMRRIELRPVVVDEMNVYRCVAVARATGIVLPDEPVLLVAARTAALGGPAVDVRILHTPSFFELSSPQEEEAGGRRTERLHYALSYSTLVVLRKHFPGLLASVRGSVSALGGLPASRAVSAMRLLGIDSACAGGATLGLAARRPGSVLMAATEHAPPWPPLVCGSVTSLPRVAVAARRVVSSRGLALDYVALSVCLQACALLLLYAQRATFTDRMHVYLEAVACGGPTLALAIPGSAHDRPLPRQDTPAFVLHGLCWLAAQVILLGQLHCRPWYAQLTERYQRRLDASVLFLLASYQLPLLCLQLAAFRGGVRLGPVLTACALPLATTTALMLPWATPASLALGLPRWPRGDKGTVLLRIGIALAATLSLLADCLAQTFVAPKFRGVGSTEPAETRRVPVAETHFGQMPHGTALGQDARAVPQIVTRC
ncbi:LOW QUALITY PROTEIN: uncharacterized protein LOC144150231 [Haemaphysalis longicornis]